MGFVRRKTVSCFANIWPLRQIYVCVSSARWVLIGVEQSPTPLFLDVLSSPRDSYSDVHAMMVPVIESVLAALDRGGCVNLIPVSVICVRCASIRLPYFDDAPRTVPDLFSAGVRDGISRSNTMLPARSRLFIELSPQASI